MRSTARQTPRALLSVAALIASGCAFVGVAFADASCKQQVTGDYRACKEQCKDDYRSDRLTCRNVDPTCGNPCLDARQACRYGYEDILSTGQLPSGGMLANCATGTDGCRAQLVAAKTACGAPCNGNTACDDCVDAAQVASFVCRDTCHESWRANAEAEQIKGGCRTAFQDCITACPPAQ
jgi:hypothetical protein